MKRQKKPREVKKRQIAFKSWLIENEMTQLKLANMLGIGISAITRSIERGVFATGVFADWWKENIEKKGEVA